MSVTTNFPAPFRLNNRLVWDRLDIENYKRAMIGIEPRERNPEEPITLVSTKQLVIEFPFGRRWLGKLVQGRVRELPSSASARNPAEQPATA